jgi:hypothetical protein
VNVTEQTGSPRPFSTITISGLCQGWPIAISFTGKLTDLPAYLERLAAAGITPAGAAPQKRRQAVEPIYQPDGTPCCPKHERPLREGQYGLHCTAKDPEGKNGYCDLKFNS